MEIAKYYNLIRWALLLILSVAFMYFGVIKLMGGKAVAELVSWGFPAWSAYAIGGIQVFAALGLFYHSTVRLGIFLMTVIAIGAILTLAGKHLFYPDIFYPILLLLCLFGTMYLKAKRPEEEEGRWGLI